MPGITSAISSGDSTSVLIPTFCCNATLASNPRPIFRCCQGQESGFGETTLITGPFPEVLELAQAVEGHAGCQFVGIMLADNGR